MPPAAVTPSLVAVVPLRAGSKGFPGKNTALLAGRPLYQHSLEQALAAGADRVVVTTDIEDVLAADHDPRVVLHRRPPALAGDAVAMDPVLSDVLDTPGLVGPDDTVVLLQATSPLRRPEQIRAAVGQLAEPGVDLVMSVCRADSGVLKYGTVEDGRFVALRDPAHPFTNRQALPAVHRPNGAIYVFGAAWYRTHRTFAAATVAAHEMAVEDSHDIDTAADLARCAEVVDARERTHP